MRHGHVLEHEPAHEVGPAAREQARHETTEGVGDDVGRPPVLGRKARGDGQDVVRQLRQGVAARPGTRAVAAQVDGDNEPVARQAGAHLPPVRRRLARRVDEEDGRERAGLTPAPREEPDRHRVDVSR